ncbi:hypothetical protein P152DRAFT_482923 [Eremomyces bilateralis CBS 781.70]|uniref:Uncharacterized protein n=1 Tax=Eremomyces bilateralis CBS 781.70 TaxID=1392243 RepID=A0A6G1G0J6_9PEZI|nr:uncharacterized protein P152DRAFT_482923 [Eremomyces bilateralis CBS 781.70]KAF1811451.1 hypothetical protein P152DRAFT_482923 [Eremomyces bilateralis CBS 781.70]
MRRIMESDSKTQQSAINTLVGDISKRAEGVFLWVRLVLDELMEDCTAGEPIEAFTERLNIRPSDLETSYEHMLRKVPEKYRNDAAIMIEILQECIHCISARAFVEACRAAPYNLLEDSMTATKQLESYSNDDLERFIRSRSGGLLETKVSSSIYYLEFDTQTLLSPKEVKLSTGEVPTGDANQLGQTPNN